MQSHISAHFSTYGEFQAGRIPASLIWYKVFVRLEMARVATGRLDRRPSSHRSEHEGSVSKDNKERRASQEKPGR